MSVVYCDRKQVFVLNCKKLFVNFIAFFMPADAFSFLYKELDLKIFAEFAEDDNVY